MWRASFPRWAWICPNSCGGDNAGRLEHVLREALTRSDLVITTGGLGPTDDDLTKEAVARVTGAPLEEHAASLEQLGVVRVNWNPHSLQRYLCFPRIFPFRYTALA
ncbi:molybdopterin-binding protein [uncultured Desulfovibrio sp.]|uniref:molybdopterin-binding protein n=1 Tax=uncultured Desulfovibrio sp. TaxID=167968 RepID=UPI00266F6B49|nr:molybdopterin-binding protein [uncultured Desulfovibrio sp.]